jgi:hypothetical protein
MTIPAGASAAVFHASELMPEGAVSVQGPDFDTHISLRSLLASYERIGFQANSLGKAIEIVNRMVSSSLFWTIKTESQQHEPHSVNGDFRTNPSQRTKTSTITVMPFAFRHAATSFLVTPPISSRLVYVK